jgi:hypothetical protein
VGGSVPSQTFLTSPPQRAKREGEVRNNNYTPPPTQKVKVKVKIKIKIKVKTTSGAGAADGAVTPVSGAEAAQPTGYPGQWCSGWAARGHP